MLTTLYDQDEVLELFIASERREAAEEAKAEAEKEAKETAKKAAKQLYANDVPVDIIAKSLKYDVKTVESWIS